MRPSASGRRPRSRGHADATEIASALLKWFPKAARDLPWRRTLDPYAIWVSEIMLQQTQVKTVIPYWERWMRELPSTQALADAPSDLVLRLWEGLGYYSRARNLQKGARQIVVEHHGRFPEEPDAMLELPGIGRYTAGAIGSIAFNLPVPILDGNVIRVLSRLHAIPGDPKSGETSRQLWRFADEVVVAAAALPRSQRMHGGLMRMAGNSSIANQSLMEIGATICLPATPRCAQCPLEVGCAAHRAGTMARFPELRSGKATIVRRFATVLWTHRGRWLVRKRPPGGLNPGFWELPNLEIDATADATAALGRWLRVAPNGLSFLGKLRRTATNNRITEELFRLRHAPLPGMPSAEFVWMSPAKLALLPMMTKHRELLRNPCRARFSTSSESA